MRNNESTPKKISRLSLNSETIRNLRSGEDIPVAARPTQPPGCSVQTKHCA